MSKAQNKHSRRLRALFAGFTIIVLAVLIALICLAVAPNPVRDLTKEIEQNGGFVLYRFYGPAALRTVLGDAWPFKTPVEINMGAGTTDADLRKLRPFRSVSIVTLSGTQIRGPGLVYLTNFSSLQILDLAKSGVADEGLAYVTNLPTLRTLILAQLDIGDEGLINVQYLPRLENLNIAQTRITDSGLSYLFKLSLKELDVRGTKVTENGIALVTNKIQTLESTPVLK